MSEEVPKLEIGLELLHKVWRDKWRPGFCAFGHLVQKPPVPGVPMDDASVEIDHDPAKQILDSRVERVQQGCQSGELNGAWVLGTAFLQEGTMDFQKLSQLSLLDGDLLSQFRPHVEEVPCFADRL